MCVCVCSCVFVWMHAYLGTLYEVLFGTSVYVCVCVCVCASILNLTSIPTSCPLYINIYTVLGGRRVTAPEREGEKGREGGMEE